MPRTPASLTVESKDGGYWDVADAEGNWKGSFDTAADARAFVALPALEQRILEMAASKSDAVRHWATLLTTALAAADGPSPQQEK